MYSLFFAFFFLRLCFCFLSCFYVLKIKNFLILVGFAPTLIIGGLVPWMPPRVYAYVRSSSVLGSMDKIVLYCIVLYCIVLYCIVLYCIVSIHLYSASCSAHQSEALL